MVGQSLSEKPEKEELCDMLKNKILHLSERLSGGFYCTDKNYWQEVIGIPLINKNICSKKYLQ